MFQRELPDTAQQLHEAYTESDFALMERIVHRLKGASANVGGKRLAAMARELEAAARSRDANAVEQWYSEVQTEITKLKQTLNQQQEQEKAA